MRRVLCVSLSLFIFFYSVVLPVKASEAITLKAQIVFIADTSGSMEQADKAQYIKDALKLSIDIAPYDAMVSLITFNDKIVSENDFVDTNNESDRTKLKEKIDQIVYAGNTDLGVALDKALDILQSSDEESVNKHIVFLGDFVEGGYTTLSGTAAYEKEIASLNELATNAKSQNIRIDMVLVNEPPKDSVVAPHVLELSEKTGGQLLRLPDSSDFPKAIQTIFFESFEYLKSAVSVGNVAEGQSIDIPMPTDYVNRARIYVAASSPATEVKASYAGASLDGEFNRSYSMIYLNRPARDGVSVTLTPGISQTADIYLLLDYTPYLNVSAVNEMVTSTGEKEAKQVTTLTAEIRDTQSGQPFLSTPFSKDVDYIVKISGPDGKQIELVKNPNNSYEYTFQPQSYGNYMVTAGLKVGDVFIQVPAGSVKVEDIRPVEKPKNWALIIAICVGSILVIAGLVTAHRIKKKEATFQGAVEMSSDYRFHGKLSVYAVMLEGGNREIRPFDFALHTLNEKRITLRSILDSVGENDTYNGAEEILFLVGPEESVVVRNNSQAEIKVMGRSYDYRSTTQLFYGQKMYIIFEKDENEIEINYRNIKQEESQSMQFNIRSRQVR